MCLDWKCIHQINDAVQQQLSRLLQKYQTVFREQLGVLKGFQAHILVDPAAQPVFCRARSVPYSIWVNIEEELDRLVQEGILEPVQYSDWAAPIVTVVKADKTSVRICGDFKLTVNRASKLDHNPIPRVEDLFATLSGGQAFSKLNMSSAYQQLLPLRSRRPTV